MGRERHVADAEMSSAAERGRNSEAARGRSQRGVRFLEPRPDRRRFGQGPLCDKCGRRVTDAD
jgi:hypothetical protein